MIKVEIGSNKKVYNLSEEQSTFIKEELTLENPQYEQVKKYSKYTNTRVPKYLFYYMDKSDYLAVPLGYNIPFEHSVIDNRKEHTALCIMPFKLDLRDTQQEAYEEYIKDTNKGVIVLPTGKGKSILGMYIAYKLKQRTLVIVHKDDLVDGWTKDSKLCFGECFDIGLIKAQKRKVGAHITLATVQTLNRLSEKELEDYLSLFGLIIVDEAHHTPASSYDFLAKADCKYKIGLTATDERTDGLRNLMQFYLGDVCFRYESDGEEEDILPVEVFTKDCSVKIMPQVVELEDNQGKIHYSLYNPKKHKKYEPMYITEAPYNKRPKVVHTELDDKAVTDESTMKLVCSQISYEYKVGHSCIVFFSQKEHCRIYKDYLVQHWNVKEDEILLYYGDAKESKSSMKERAESREVLITLATYSIATEGTNVKAWEVAFLVSSINNEKNTEQVSGRIRRANEGKLNPVRLYDFRYPNAYTLANHGYTRDRRYKKLGFKINKTAVPKRKGLFTRGFNKR